MTRIILLAIICSLFIVGVFSYKEYSKSNKLYFVIEMESSASGTSQVFFDTGHGYNETDSIAWHVQPGALQKYLFPLPALTPIKSIRFDPTNSTSVVSIKKARIENGLGDTLKNLPVQSFKSIQQISRMEISGDGLVMHTTENANDPQIVIENSSFDRLASWRDFLAKRGWIYAGYVLLSFILFMGLAKCRWQHIAETLYRLQNMLLLTICALLIGGVLGYKNYSESNKLYFVIEIESSASGTSQVFFNVGNGYNEIDSIAWSIRAGAFQRYSFPLPALPIKSIRFDPINVASVVNIKNIGIENGLGKTLKSFPVQSFIPTGQISTMDVSEGVLTIHTTENANDPQTEIENSSLDRKNSWKNFLTERSGVYAGYALVCFIAFIALAKCRLNKMDKALARIVTYSVEYPIKSIIIVGVIAAIVSCYPVVFFGMSFVSPLGAAALYDGSPWVPGFPLDGISENFRGTDVGAMAWSIAPNSVVQHDSLFRYFEFPFWTRYVGAGAPLFAQAYSGIGDILHWIPVAMDGGAIGWDIKFVLSKAVFAVGMGLLVFRLTDKLLAGLLIAVSSCFLGFFAYRFNHPAIFVLTYAPWVILQWDRLGRALASPNKHIKSYIWHGILLALITWLQLNSGTPKEGVITACFMQALGVLAFWKHISPKFGSVRTFVLACGIGIALILITAPYWLIFLDTLGKSFTNYDIPSVGTYPQWAIIGFFDNFFFQETYYSLVGPSVNLFVLLFLSSAILSLRHRQSSFVYACWGLFVLALTTAYSYIPLSVLIAIPFVNKIQHVGNTFSVPMMVIALIIAGYGIRDYLEATEKSKKTILIFSLSSLLVWWLVLALNIDNWRNSIGFLIFNFLVILVGFYQLYRRINAGRWETRGGIIILMCCFLILHVRHGMHLTTEIPQIDAYVLNPTARPDYSIKSEAIEFVKNKMDETNSPTRVIGEGFTMFPGINSRYGLEGMVSVEALRNKYYNNLMTLTDYPEYQGWGWLHLIRSDQIASRSAALDFFGIGYVLSAPGASMPKDMKLVHSSDLEVWKRDSVWPRAFFVNNVLAVHKPSDLLFALSDKSHRIFAAVENQPIPQEILNNNALYRVIPANEYRLTNNSTNFSVEANGPGIIVLGETYYPGDFVAKLNGEKVDYIRVNEASKGIWVNKAGKYDVSFTYRPGKLNQALWMSLIGLLSLILFIGISAGRSSRKISKLAN